MKTRLLRIQPVSISKYMRDVSIDMNLVDLKVWSDLSISNDFRIAPDVASWFDSKQLHVQPAALPTCWWCWFCLEVNSWSLPPRCWILWSVFHDRLVLKQPMSVDCTRSILETRRSRGPKDVLSRGLERGSRWHRCGDAFRWNRQRQIPGASSCHHASHLPSGRKDSGLQGRGLILTLCFVPRAAKKSVSKPTVAVSGLYLKTCFEFRTEEQDCG